MRNAEFWRSRKNEFRRLAEYEYRAVPDPADRRRLYAYGDYTGVKSGATGSWKLGDGLSADFRSSFEEAATMAASGLKAPAGAEPLSFWLHSLAHFLEAQEQTREDRGHLGVWDPKRGGIIRDVPAASAFYCSWLAKERAAHEAATSISGTGNAPPPKRFPNRIARRATSEGTIEAVRLRDRRRHFAPGGVSAAGECAASSSYSMETLALGQGLQGAGLQGICLQMALEKLPAVVSPFYLLD